MESYKCHICGNTDIHSIGYLYGKPYCRRCISFRGVWITENTKNIVERINVYGKRIKRNYNNHPVT